MRFTLFTLALITATAAHGQSANRQFQGLINSEGLSCSSVTRSQAIGTVEGGDALVAVACANGGRHVVRIDQTDNALSYVSDCGTLAAMSKVECFAR